MNNPFDLFQNKEAQTEQESQRLRVRLGVLIAIFSLFLLIYLGVLFNVQIVHGEEYLDNTTYTVVRTETVDTVRGEILDRTGKVLVGNRLSYNVALDLDHLGNDRAEVLGQLLDLCRSNGVTWSDSLPISDTAPWSYTKSDVFSYPVTGEDGTVTHRATLLGALAKKLKWVTDPSQADLTAGELLTAACLRFGLIKDEDDPITPEMRAVAGVLYELYLRSYEITYSQYIFARDVDITFITQVKERALPGVELETSTQRSYFTDAAAHLLGPVGALSSDEWPTYKELGYPMDAVVGKGGVELAFETYLHGSAGVRRIETDEDGNIISQTWSTQPSPGNNVVLTIDESLQAVTEQLLADFVSGLEEQAGAAAVMVDMTGGVLALASYPDFDLSTYYEDYNELAARPDRPYYNRATQGLYAPGSTFKPLTAIAALSSGTISVNDTVYCGGKYTYYPDVTPVCWIYTNVGGHHGTEGVSKAITDSCNIFFYDVGRRTGIKTLVDYATQFGLGQYTGIEITEKKGYVAGPDTSAQFGQTWYGGQTMYAAIGQDSNQFTPLQLANYIATLVNGGNHYEVHLLKEVRSADYSSTVYEHVPVLRNTIDIADRDLAAVKKGMYDLSKTNSMRPFFSDLPVEVGCKTGTAEVNGTSPNATFVCFAPYDDPQVALCIVVEKGDNGGSSLASIAAGMLNQYFAVAEDQSTAGGENELIP